MMAIHAVTRAEALQHGYDHYIGKPCRHGHSGLRHTNNGHCVECHRAHRRPPCDAPRADTYEGKPCKHCGCTTRYTRSSGHCVPCTKKGTREYRAWCRAQEDIEIAVAQQRRQRAPLPTQ